MRYWIHPDASDEHKQQVSYYEEAERGLGRRYHAEFRAALAKACENPRHYRIVYPPDIRLVRFKTFHFDLLFRAIDGVVQILAIAHHRRQPGYWAFRTSAN